MQTKERGGGHKGGTIGNYARRSNKERVGGAVEDEEKG